jgi:hypothetical protein
MSRHRPKANTIVLALAMAASCSLASPIAAESWRSDPTYLAWKASSSAAEKNAEAVEFLLKKQARGSVRGTFLPAGFAPASVTG